MCGMVVTIEYGNCVLCKIYVCVFCEFVYYSVIMYTHVYALCNYPLCVSLLCHIHTCLHCQASPVVVKWPHDHLTPRPRTDKRPSQWLQSEPTFFWYDCPLVSCYFYSYHKMYRPGCCCFLCEKYYTYFVNISSRRGKSTNLFSLN